MSKGNEPAPEHMEREADKYARRIPGLPRNEDDYAAFMAGARCGAGLAFDRAVQDFAVWLERGASAWREWRSDGDTAALGDERLERER
jgi:hypothetical protein